MQQSISLTPITGTPSPSTPLLNRERLQAIIDHYLQSPDARPDTLNDLNPLDLYRILRKEPAPIQLLFRAIFFNSHPPIPESKRLNVLVVLCTKLRLCTNQQGSAVGNELLRQYLQTRLPKSRKTVLHLAAETCPNPRVIQYLVQLAETLNIPGYVDVREGAEHDQGLTPLLAAAAALQVDNMKALLECFANPLASSKQGTVYDILIKKESDPQAIEAIALLHNQSDFFKNKFTPYQQLCQGAHAPTLLTDIIQARALLDLAHSKEMGLETYVAFLQHVSKAFASGDNDPICQRFLMDLNQVLLKFLRVAKTDELSEAKDKQVQLFSIASWLMKQESHLAALALFQRLLSDPKSIFLDDPLQIFKLLRNSAICIGKIALQKEELQRTGQFRNLYLDPIHEKSTLTELLTGLHEMLDQEALPESVRQAVGTLLCEFLSGQHPNLSLLQPLQKDQKQLSPGHYSDGQAEQDQSHLSVLKPLSSDSSIGVLPDSAPLTPETEKQKNTPVSLEGTARSQTPPKKENKRHESHVQFFPSAPDQKTTATAFEPVLTIQTWLEQATHLLDEACPPKVQERAELRRGFLKQLAEYKPVDHTMPPTPEQQRALQSLMQTLQDIQAQASVSQVSSSDPAIHTRR